MADYNDGSSGASAEGYGGPEGAPEDQAWSGDDAQKAWEDHLDEADPDHYGDYGYETTPPYAGPSVGYPSAEAAERWRKEDETAAKMKACAGTPEEWRSPCEAAAQGQQYPMGDEPVYYRPGVTRGPWAPTTQRPPGIP